MKIMDLLPDNGSTAFSFEILPPLKGMGLEKLKKTIGKLREFDPKYINITTHISEPVYKEAGGGLLERLMQKRRPGTVAVAAALQHELGIPVVPHILCSGFTRKETEYALIDLQYLGIRNLLVLRGDKRAGEKSYSPVKGGNEHALDLIEQINKYNEGFFEDGTQIKEPGEKFSYGVACYPEKHEESPNLQTDTEFFVKKVEAGANYGVTQMFFDNQKYFSFVNAVRGKGVNVPIIPGIKPLIKLSQLTNLPRIFHCDLPEEFVKEALKCKTDEELRPLGLEWCVNQCKELMKAGVPSLHFYTTGAADVVYEVAKRIY